MRLTFKKCGELLGNRWRKKLAGNTYVSSTADGAFVVVFHSTPILRFYANGTVSVNSGGYRAVTTKNRLSSFGPVLVWQDKHKWYCRVNGVEMPFRDGMTFDVNESGIALRLSERSPLTTNPDEAKLVRAFCAGECPAGVVTDWRKENGAVPV